MRNGDVVGLHYSPVWSPDGRRIAFLEGAVCGAAISKVAPDTYVVDVTTGRTAAVGRGDPVWSPTGAHIAVNADGNVEIWRSRGRRRAVFERATGAVWSPDGDRIAFSSIACWSADCYRSSIEIAARDGRGRRRLAAGLSPAWAPDGKRVAFVGPPSSTATPWAFRGLYTAAAASGRVRRLFVAPPSS